MAIGTDERGILTSWLGKLLVGFAVASIVIFDGGSILVNFFTLDSTADDIAIEVSTEVVGTGRLDTRQLEGLARELAREAGARLLDFSVNEEGVVHVKLRRRADTLVVGRIGAIEDWALATAEGQAGSS